MRHLCDKKNQVNPEIWRVKIQALATKKIQASSLIEVTVATVLLVISTSAALLIYLQVIHSGNTLRQTRWELWLQDYALQVKQAGAYESRTIEMTEGRLKKRISLYKENPQLVVLELVFYPLDSENPQAKPALFGVTSAHETRSTKAYVHREIIYNPASNRSR